MERNEAIERRLQTYNTGRPCVHGHEPIRYTKSGICVACAKANTKNAKKKVDDRAAATISKQVLLRAWMHPDDAADVRALVVALNANRGILAPPEEVAPDPRPFDVGSPFGHRATMSAAPSAVPRGTASEWDAVPAAKGARFLP